MGKSTLLRQAMLESATLGRGAEHLVRCRPSWTATSLHQSIARAVGLPDDAAMDGPPDELAGEVAEWFWAAAPNRIGLVIDDLHEVDDGALAYVVALTSLLPANAHVVVASRDHPRVAALLMTADPVVVVEEGSLLFTDEEVAQLAEGVGIGAAALESAGGWPAVLALTVHAGPDVAGAYLYQSVLAGLSRRQQGDLALAAALGEIDRDVATAVLEGPTNALSAVPLVELPPAGGIIVHDLWKDPLSGLVSPDRLADAARTAARFATRAGDIERAVSVLCGAGLLDDARESVIRHIAEAADRVPLDRIDRWLRLLVAPQQALLRQTLQLLRTGLLEGHLDPERLDALIRRVRQAGELDLEALLGEVRFAVAWSADDVDQCLRIADRLAELHREGVEIVAHAPHTAQITAARAEGDNERVVALIRGARDVLGDAGGLAWNVPLELEGLLALGRPFEALDRLKIDGERLQAANVRSMTYGLTYWFTGQGDRAVAELDALLVQPGRFYGIERSWVTTAELFRRWRGVQSDRAVVAPDDPDEVLSSYSRVCEGLCEVAQLIEEGDEAGAEERISDLTERLPPTDGIALNAWFMGAAAWYVLRESDRPLLDGFMVNDMFGQANRVFRAFVKSREVGTLAPEDIDGWVSPAQLGTLLPLRWATELALRLPASHEEMRDETLQALEMGGSRVLEQFAAGEDELLSSRAISVLAERPIEPSAPIRINLFGVPTLDLPGLEEPSDWRRGRVKALLGLLVVRGRVSREVAIDALWPELELPAGRRNLRVTLSYLVRTLEPERAKHTPSWFIDADQLSMLLNREGLVLDVFDFAAALASAKDQQRNGLASKAIESLRLACSLYRGPFLEGIDDEWVLDERNVFSREVVAAHLRLSALLVAGGSEEGATWARRATEIDPFSIEAHEALINALFDERSPERQAAQARLESLTSR